MPNTVTFSYRVGLVRPIFTAARLRGSWDRTGRFSDQWTSMPMEQVRDESGCFSFRVAVSFPDESVGNSYRWGVEVDGPAGEGVWAIPAEIDRLDSQDRFRTFTVLGGTQEETYYLTYLRHLGANKHFAPSAGVPGIRFAVWAPNARAVELVEGDLSRGYIDDAGGGTKSAPGAFQLQKEPRTGIWSIDSDRCPTLGSFADWDHRRPYMFRITRDDGSIAYRSDLYSRCQIGSGKIDPKGQTYTGDPKNLDGTKSCSIVIDPEQVMEIFDEPFPQRHWLDEERFWASEKNPRRPVPTRLEDIVIYELHVPGLAYGSAGPGTLADAIDLLDHLVELGVNAVELLPMAEYKGWAEWGYGTSHYFAIEYVSGGRDQFKHFVRACHQRGIAVLLDVVYNHFTQEGERAEWAYDSTDPTRNIYYWYDGHPTDYPRYQAAVDSSQREYGGYVDNDSTGWAPRYWEELVRQLFIGSAVALMQEFHVDGFRVDQTSSIHAYAKLHADGRPADAARAFGVKFLREWTRTLRLLNPNVFLIAEDHSGWEAVVETTDRGGLGFDSAWYSDFYHHLEGDTGRGPECANLLRMAGYGTDEPLALDYFAGALSHASRKTVVYNESHDEAGNSHGSDWVSARSIQVAVNRAPLIGPTRDVAEARCRAEAALSLLSAGIPMFFMGAELGFSEPYRYDDFMQHREDFRGLRATYGERLFRFYRELLALRAERKSLRGGGLRVVYVHNANRVIAFHRWTNGDQVLVVVSLANRPYGDGYDLLGALPDGLWHERLNSDASVYGGNNIGNLGGTIPSGDGHMRVVLPAHGAVVFTNS